MTKQKIAITIGDINGIGPEVIVKALSNKNILKLCTPIIYGSSKVLSYHRNIVKADDFNYVTCSSADKSIDGRINVVNCWEDNVHITLGKVTPEGGKFAHIALDRACQELEKGFLNALVTAPINKSAMKASKFRFPGHTEYLSDAFKVKRSLMTMISSEARIALVTNHLPIKDVEFALSRELLEDKIDIFESSLQRDFGIEKPKIAILGLNPHAGDGGALGTEEQDLIIPIIKMKKEQGKFVFGPYSADGFFGSHQYKKFDGILAMYHDQGLIPFKMISFGNGTNFTANLPIVRTSPDHGTAYDIVGQNLAKPDSMREAIYHAIDISNNRLNYEEMRSNAVSKKPKPTEEVEE